MSKTYTLNKGYSVKKNGRTAPKISKGKFLELVADFNRTYSKKYDCVDFEEKKSKSIYYIMCILLYVLRKEADKLFVSDFKGIHFDWENKDIIGDVHIINGIPCYHLYAGGDWECALHFFFYYDGKRFRVYVPKNGNNWRPDIKSVIGNNDDDDEYCTKVLRKRGELKDGYRIVNASSYIVRNDKLMMDEFALHIKCSGSLDESYIKEDFFDDMDDISVEDKTPDNQILQYEFELYVGLKERNLKNFNASYFMKCLNSFQKIEIVSDIAMFNDSFKDLKNVVYPFKTSYPQIRVKFNSYIKTVADVVRFLNIIWNGTQNNKIIIGLRKAEDDTYVYGMPETVFVLSRIRRIINMSSSSLTELNAMNHFMDFCRMLFGMPKGGTSEKPGVLTQNMCRVILQTNCGAVFRMDIQKLLQDKFPKFHNIPAEHIYDFYTTFNCLNDYVNSSLDSGKTVFYCQIEDHEEPFMVYRELKQREDLNSLLEYIPVKTVRKLSRVTIYHACMSLLIHYKENVLLIPLGMFYNKETDKIMTAMIGVKFSGIISSKEFFEGLSGDLQK